MYVRLKYLRDIVTYIFNNYYSFLVFPRARYESRNGKRSNFCVENPHCKYFLYRKCQSVSITCFLTGVVFGLLHSAYCTHWSVSNSSELGQLRPREDQQMIGEATLQYRDSGPCFTSSSCLSSLLLGLHTYIKISQGTMSIGTYLSIIMAGTRSS